MTRILIVDDEDFVRSFMADALRMEGYEVEDTGSAEAALRIHAKSPVDLLITDIFMPEMDGLELIKRIRATTPNLAIIAVSGGARYDRTQYLDTARIFGAKRLLEKPLDLDAFLDAVGDVIKHAESAT